MKRIDDENNNKNKDHEDEKNQEDGADEAGLEVITVQPKYKLGHRHLTEIADINTWSEQLWRVKQWSGTSLFRCFDFRREQVDNPNGGDPIVRCRVKARRCMCSEGEPACDESLKNYWQPRLVNQEEEVIVFGDDEVLPKVNNISTVLRKTLPIDRKTIRSYFGKFPAKCIKKRHAQLSDDDEEGEQDSDLKTHVDRIHANPNVSRGMNWFSDFFNEQEAYSQAMCDECRQLKSEEAELKSKETSMIAARLLRRSMRDQRAKDQAAALARRQEGKNPKQHPTRVVEDDLDEDDGTHETKLKNLRIKLRELVKELKAHVKETKGDDMHQYYHTGTIFGPDNDGGSDSLSADDSDEEMKGEDEEKIAHNDDMPDDDFIVEDELASEFRVEKLANIRKVHKRGCLIGDLVVFRSEVLAEPFYVGKVLRRCPDKPADSFLVQYYSNSDKTFDKSYLPGWIRKDTRIYYQETPNVRYRKTGERDAPYTQSMWNQTIITWSCDWKLNAKHFLPTLARRRCEQMPGVVYVAPKR